MHLAQHYYLQLVHHKNKPLLLDLVLVLWRLHQYIVTLTIMDTHTITMEVIIIMVDTIVVDTITITGIDTEMGITIIVGIDTITDVVTEHKLGTMVIIRIKRNTIIAINITDKIMYVEKIQTDLQETEATPTIELVQEPEVTTEIH